MLKVEGVMDIHELHRAGHSVREISRVTGCSRNTVKRVLGGEHSLKRKRVEPRNLPGRFWGGSLRFQ